MFAIYSPEGRDLGMYYRSRRDARLAANALRLVGLGTYSVGSVRGR